MTDPTPTPDAPPAGTPEPTPPTPPAEPTKPDQPEETDWKAEARKWEKLAKANNNATKELEKLRTAAMSEQEKAVAEAEKRGRLAAAKENGEKLARAEFRAAVAAAGIDLGEASDLIDVRQFVGEDGEVDEAVIKKAVGKLAKVATRTGASRSGGDAPPGNGRTLPPSDPRAADFAQIEADIRAGARRR